MSVANQAGKEIGGVPWNRGVKLLTNRPKIHTSHETSHPLAAGWESIFGQVIHHSATASAAVLGVEHINPSHHRQRRFTHRWRLVVERGSRQPVQRPLPADAELGMVVIDQLVEFPGIRAAENLIRHFGTI